MATLKDFRDERVRKLNELKAMGVNPYPANSGSAVFAGEKRVLISAVINEFDDYEGKKIIVAGRIKSIRKFGKIAFVVVKDGSASIQLFWKLSDAANLAAAEINPEDRDLKSADSKPNGQAIMGKSSINNELTIKEIGLLDTGDFIECFGTVIKTQTKEISVQVGTLRLLTKALRPLPSDQEGFTDKEERLRRRYVDTNVNLDVFNRFIRRSNFWQSTRNFLLKNDFIEINIPVLESVAGGADANPFVTHMDALDQDFYLRISHELPLKRLLVGGYEKVFDIGPRFRNENYSDEHLPEHIAMEWYWAYADWNDGMKFTQQMVRYIADNTWGKRQFTLANGMQIDLGSDESNWPKVSFVGVIKERYNIDVFNTTLKEVQAKVKENKINVEDSDNINRCIDKLWKKIRVELSGPAFLVDIPTFLQPLAKNQASDPRLSEQFNLLLGGTEACKAYSELNDPIDQLDRFNQQQAMRDAGDDEAMMLDSDYVEALEYGMPPACGYGNSERLFWMLEGVTAREGVPFPALRNIR